MRARSASVAVLLALVLAAEAQALAQAPRRFVPDTLNALSSVANLRRGMNGDAVVAIVTGEASAGLAKDLVRELQYHDTAKKLAIRAVVASLAGSSAADAARLEQVDKATPLAAIILLDPPPASVAVTTSFAALKNVLTISFRLEDVGVAGITLVDPLRPYLYQRQLAAEGVKLNEEIRRRSTAIPPIDPRGPYVHARNEMDRRGDRDWPLIVVLLKKAILARPADSQNRVRFDGQQSEPYLPHLHLAAALYQLGDCDAADGELAAARMQRGGASAAECDSVASKNASCRLGKT
jgi:hypothetical protein